MGEWLALQLMQQEVLAMSWECAPPSCRPLLGLLDLVWALDVLRIV